MKKVMLSLIVLSALSTTVFAQRNTDARSKRCPASTCTDHSYDEAYSGGRAPVNGNHIQMATSAPARIVDAPAQPSRAWAPVTTRTSDAAYSMNDYTIYGRFNRTGTPDPYNGDDAPSYDGAAKNAYRNMRANNESAPLPPSTGQ